MSGIFVLEGGRAKGKNKKHLYEFFLPHLGNYSQVTVKESPHLEAYNLVMIISTTKVTVQKPKLLDLTVG